MPKRAKGDLTDKEKIFCREYILDWNATRAAIKAGYSQKTATEIGYENLRKPHIEAYIKEIQSDLEKVSGISRLKVLNEFAKLAFASIAHLHNTWIERKEFEKLTEDQKACISEIQTRTKGYKQEDGPDIEVQEIKVKLYDKQRALDSIAKMLGYNEPDKLSIPELRGFKIIIEDK